MTFPREKLTFEVRKMSLPRREKAQYVIKLYMNFVTHAQYRLRFDNIAIYNTLMKLSNVKKINAKVQD